MNYTTDKELLLGKGDTWPQKSGPDPCPSCSKIGTHRLSCPNDKVAPWGSWKKPATVHKDSEVNEMLNRTNEDVRNHAYDVYHRGKNIDTVFYSTHQHPDDVKRSLVNHDGYHPDIVVKKYRSSSKTNEEKKMSMKQFKLFREEIKSYEPQKTQLGGFAPKAKKEAEFADTHKIDTTDYPAKNTPDGWGKTTKHEAQMRGVAGERKIIKQGTSDLPDKSGFKNTQTPVTFANKREGEFKPLRISPSAVTPALKEESKSSRSSREIKYHWASAAKEGDEHDKVIATIIKKGGLKNLLKNTKALTQAGNR